MQTDGDGISRAPVVGARGPIIVTYRVPDNYRLRLLDGLRKSTALCDLGSIDEMVATLAARSAEINIAALGPEWGSTAVEPSVVAAVRAASPSAVILPMAPMGPQHGDVVAALFGAGATRIIPTNGEVSIRDIARKALEDAMHGSIAASVIHMFAGRMPRDLMAFAEACLRRTGSRRLDVICVDIGISKRRICYLCEKYDLPPPERVRTLLRLAYYVLRMTRHPGCTLRKLAREADVEDSALANAFQRTLQLTSTAAKARGPESIVEMIFGRSPDTQAT